MNEAYLNTLLWVAGTVALILVGSGALGATARAVVRRRGASQSLQQRTFAGYAFAAPWIIGFVIFVVAPMAASLWWSFTNFKTGDDAAWVGLQNYGRLLGEDKDFRAALFNSLFLTVVGLPLQLIVALGLALLLSQRLRGERTYRMAFYLPVVLGLNPAALLCGRLMLNANNGLVNSVLREIRTFPPVDWLLRAFIYVMEGANALFLGMQTGSFNLWNTVLVAGFPGSERVPLWLQSPLWTKTSIILILVWGCGSMMLIYLAALYGVPREIHEAAEVDGATPWQRFRMITLPLITPATFYNLIVGTIATIQIFEQTYVFFRDSPTVAQSAYSVVYYLWRATFRFNEIGYGSAISWILFLLIMVITVVQLRLQNRWVQYELK